MRQALGKTGSGWLSIYASYAFNDHRPSSWMSLLDSASPLAKVADPQWNVRSEYAPLTPSCPSSSCRCLVRYSRVNWSLSCSSSGGQANRGASGFQLVLSSYRCQMAVTGQLSLLDANSVIVTPLRQGSVVQRGSVNGACSSSNWMYLQARFHCTNSEWPWTRLCTDHVISADCRKPHYAIHKGPQSLHRMG